MVIKSVFGLDGWPREYFQLIVSSAENEFICYKINGL